MTIKHFSHDTKSKNVAALLENSEWKYDVMIPGINTISAIICLIYVSFHLLYKLFVHLVLKRIKINS